MLDKLSVIIILCPSAEGSTCFEPSPLDCQCNSQSSEAIME